MDTKNQLMAYADRLYRAALAKAKDSHVAEDIAQEAFLAAAYPCTPCPLPGGGMGGRQPPLVNAGR